MKKAAANMEELCLLPKPSTLQRYCSPPCFRKQQRTQEITCHEKHFKSTAEKFKMTYIYKTNKKLHSELKP